MINTKAAALVFNRTLYLQGCAVKCVRVHRQRLTSRRSFLTSNVTQIQPIGFPQKRKGKKYQKY
jgi:hypothetical protein